MKPMTQAGTCLAAAALVLAGCGDSEPPAPTAPGDERIVGKDWQVTGIYTDPEALSTISEAVTNVPSISFGESTAVGTTGCARFVAKVSYAEGEDAANVRDADYLRFDEVRYDERSEDCTGEAAWAHNSLSRLIATDREFDISINPNHQLVLTLRDGKVDSPAVEFVSL
ncbi:hypothetical protein [Corynebacterium confusum]|uniref:hypothetical protein n=1 Tax=Corynebacterium confusum TaxID=71254 RepID=UPI0025B4F909|nr:hypothetical protein [Corynebacterium confusum]WJY90456.1 hypothetical protein CCONF_09805 [Corynebacterium confusum]